VYARYGSAATASLSVLRALPSRSHVHRGLAVLPVLAGNPGWGESLHGASGQVTTKRSCCGSRQTAARSAGCGPRPSGTCPKARSSTRTVGAATSSSPSARPAPPRPAPASARTRFARMRACTTEAPTHHSLLCTAGAPDAVVTSTWGSPCLVQTEVLHARAQGVFTALISVSMYASVFFGLCLWLFVAADRTMRRPHGAGCGPCLYLVNRITLEALCAGQVRMLWESFVHSPAAVPWPVVVSTSRPPPPKWEKMSGQDSGQVQTHTKAAESFVHGQGVDVNSKHRTVV
jgi:hypothetical protein